MYWIRHFAQLIRKELRRRSAPDKPKNVSVHGVSENPNLTIFKLKI